MRGGQAGDDAQNAGPGSSLGTFCAGRRMSVANFCRLMHGAKLGKNDKEWFPRWIRRYAFHGKIVKGKLAVSLDG